MLWSYADEANRIAQIFVVISNFFTFFVRKFGLMLTELKQKAKSTILIVWLALCLVAIPSILLSQNGLQISARLIIKKGELQGSKISIYKNGNLERQMPVSSKGVLELTLDYDCDYIFSFEKEGYISKKIAIDTRIPDKLKESFDKVTAFDVELFKQSENEVKEYKNPVARIQFSSQISDFVFDTDYSLRVQQEIAQANKDLVEERKKQESLDLAKKEEEKRQQLLAEAQKRAEAEAQRKAAEEKARQVEAEQLKKEAEERRLAEAKAKEEALKREEELRLKAREEARIKAEQEALRIAEQKRIEEEKLKQEQERIRQEEEAKRKAAEEARIKEEQRIREEAERIRVAEEAKKKADEEARLKELEQQKKEAEERAIADAKLKEEQRRIELEKAQKEAERKKFEEEERLKAEQQQKLLFEEQKKRDKELRLKLVAEKMSAKIGTEDAERVVTLLTPEDVTKKYTRERTDEVIRLPRIVITRTVYNRNDKITFYTRVDHEYGAIFYFKDGYIISEEQYKAETK